MFPLTERDVPDKSHGARHRAALGLSDESDAVIVVVSEETGAISIAHRGRLQRDLSADQLRRQLSDLLAQPAQLVALGLAHLLGLLRYGGVEGERRVVRIAGEVRRRLGHPPR